MPCKVSDGFKLQMVNDMAVKTGTQQTFVCVADGQTKYTVYDYRYDITGDVKLSYNDANHLIVTLENGFISPAGSGVWPSSAAFAAPWYGSLSGPLPCWRSIAIAASFNPDMPSDGEWKKCQGGWYSAGTNCNTTCTKDKYGNPPGGTWMYWSDTQAGTAWEKTQYQRGGRRLETLTWDMGEVRSTDGQDLQVYIFARGERSCTWDLPACGSMPWTPSTIPRVAVTAPVCPLDPPVLESIAQKQRVCENCVDAYLTFAASELGGRDRVLIVVDYKYGDEPWDVSLHSSVEMTVNANQPVTVLLPCLIPERKVCWRAQYLTTEGETMKSEYSSDCFMTEFIPPVWMEVPPLSKQECTLLTQGKPVDVFDHLTNYWGDEL